jgi:hypothetical protein
MPDRPSNGGRETEPPTESASPTVDPEVDGSEADGSEADGPEVDDEVQRRLREAYLNDAERELIATGVRSSDDEVVVEFRTPHGDATHTERFPAPRNGSLAESEAFLAFLETAGVSPLDVDELVGARVPATYEGGEWRLDESYLSADAENDGDAGIDGGGGTSLSGPRSAWTRAREWLWTYRYWLFAAILVGGELLFVAFVIVLYA